MNKNADKIRCWKLNLLYVHTQFSDQSRFNVDIISKQPLPTNIMD